MMAVLASSSSIKEVYVDNDWAYTTRDFFVRCQIKKLTLVVPKSQAKAGMFEGLRGNGFVENLSLFGLGSRTTYAPWNLFQNPSQGCAMILKELTLSLNCGPFSNTQLSGLCNLVRQPPIPTLKSFRMIKVDIREGRSLLGALAKSTGVERFELLLDTEELEVFEDVREFLTKSSSISSLTVGVRGTKVMPLATEKQLLESASLNTRLTHLSLEPLFRTNPKFKRSVQRICIRNRTDKFVRDLEDSSVSLGGFAASMEDVRRDCEDNDESPEFPMMKMIYAGVRSNPNKVVGNIANVLAAQRANAEDELSQDLPTPTMCCCFPLFFKRVRAN